MRPYESWDDPPPSGCSSGFKWFVVLWVLAVGSISAAIIFRNAEQLSRPSAADNASELRRETRVDGADKSYSGYRGRVLGINGDGEPVSLDDFEGSFIWVDMEGPWCSASAAQSQAISAIRDGRRDVVFLSLVTSDYEPLTKPTRHTARAWAREQRLPPDRVVAYASTISVPYHILYSPQGHELMRVTATLSAARLEGLLDTAIASWQPRTELVLH